MGECYVGVDKEERKEDAMNFGRKRRSDQSILYFGVMIQAVTYNHIHPPISPPFKQTTPQSPDQPHSYKFAASYTVPRKPYT